jgi:hypothetical protein
LQDKASDQNAAAEHDGIVHVGFEYGPEGVAADRNALEVLIEAARASGRKRGCGKGWRH